MIVYIFVVFVLGLILGSFINALVWRLRQLLDDDGNARPLPAKDRRKYSIAKGRSMCVHCGHVLQAKDLVPLFSWLILRGKCRYCQKPISKEYPIVEFLVAVLFVFFYVAWPKELVGTEWILFVGFLLALIPMIAMSIYDIKWYILPSSLVYSSTILYSLSLAIYPFFSGDFYRVGWAFLAGALFWTLFMLLYITSHFLIETKRIEHPWLGGGDVRLSFLLGLMAGTITNVFVAIFVASIAGLIGAVASYGASGRKLDMFSKIPFGPYLIFGALFALLWGGVLVSWYQSLLVV